MGDDLPIRIEQTLVNLLGMYTSEEEDVLILEAVANGIDAGATEIRINFHKEEGNNFIEIHNNGAPMNRNDFINYHTISLSSKTKGKSIGFAGVGAKIFLGSTHCKEIITITGKGKNFFVSRMYKKNRLIKHDTSLKTLKVDKLVPKSHNQPKGTTYMVNLSVLMLNNLHERIMDIIQFWFNQRILTNRMSVFVDGKKVNAWKPKGQKFRRTVKYKSSEMLCYFYISDDPAPEGYLHLTYSVFGKRIKNEVVNFSNNIKDGMNNKVFGTIEVDILADYLTSNKEDFKKITKVNEVLKKAKQGFYDFLKKQDLISGDIHDTRRKQAIDSKLTERLNEILKNKEYKFLGPLMRTAQQRTPMLNTDGDTDADLDPDADRPWSPIMEPPPIDVTGNDADDRDVDDENSADTMHGEGVLKDDDKDAPLKAKIKRRRSGGIDIYDLNDPHSDKECWVQETPEMAIVYNTAHPLNQKYREASAVYNYHKARVIAGAVVSYGAKNDETINAEKALNFSRDILNQMLE